MQKLIARWYATLPTEITPAIRRLSVAALIGQIVLIATGAIVRLTGSGLGCPTWPRCTAESLTSTPEMGVHGIIEFGNRLLTFALAIVVLMLVVALWRLRKDRPMLFWLALGQLFVIPAQAVVGGLSVLSGLNPWVVGLHFLVSASLVIVATLAVNRAYARTGTWARSTEPLPRWIKIVAALAFTCVCLAVMFGVMVTGSGPHAGAADAPRNNLDPYLVTRIHAMPVYVLVAASLVLLVAAYMKFAHLRVAALGLFLVVIVQGVIGYVQFFTGVPAVLVGLHMIGASLLLAAGTNILDITTRSITRPVAATPHAD